MSNPEGCHPSPSSSRIPLPHQEALSKHVSLTQFPHLYNEGVGELSSNSFSSLNWHLSPPWRPL